MPIDPASPPTLAPPGATWPALIRRTAPEEALRFRRELGLPVDGPIVMTGHQATFWHPGILAKYLAADACARRAGAHIAWIIVDQDRARRVPIRYPALDKQGRLAARTFDVADRGPLPAVPADAHPLAREGLAAILAALSHHATITPLSDRIVRATRELLGPLITLQPTPISASQLSRTTAFAALLGRLTTDHARAREAYNHAVARHPRARLRPLEDRELPLWHIRADGTRASATLDLAAQHPVEQLAPKALVLTALLRLHACDLFIHGTGGGTGGSAADEHHEGYDSAMESWFTRWLGPDWRAELAPAVVATATRTLPLLPGDAPTAETIAYARWIAHRARHDPATLGDHTAAQERLGLVRVIQQAATRVERAAAFRTLHELESGYRARHAAAIQAAQDRAQQLAASTGQALIAADRTWPFALYPSSVLQTLRDQIEQEFEKAHA